MRDGKFALVWLAVAAAAVAARGEAPSSVTLHGQARRLTEVLAERRLEADTGPIAEQVVVATDDGQVVPLLSDPASRALFLDERLRGRPIELEGRRFTGLPYLQVTVFRIRENNAWVIPEYYCDVCAISVRYPQICPCCQGEMVLRTKPAEP